ncbi:MAG: GAF domain-containing protein [Anaerolineae bacterium]|jgi:GAF domain-containing protein/HAMP domain-containing protein
MKVLQFLKNLRLSFKAIVVVVLAFVTLQIALSNVGRIAVGRLITQVGQNRAEQEAEVIQSRFAEARQDILKSADYLLSQIPLQDALAQGQSPADIRAMMVVGMLGADLDNVAIVDSNGVYVTGVQKRGEDIIVSPQRDGLLATAMSGTGTKATGVIFETDGSDLWLAAAIPLRSPERGVIGALLAARQVNDELLQEVNFSREDVHLALVAGGRIMAQAFPTPELLGEISPALLDEAVSEQVASGQTVIADDLLSASNGTPYGLAHVPLVEQDDVVATIGVAVDLGQLSVFQLQLMTTMVVMLVVFGLVAIFGAALFVRHGIALPIGRLISVIERIAGGDYGQRAEVTSSDEIGQLSAGFNSMATQLQETLEGLEQREAALQRRSLQMQASADVGRAATSILETDRLIQHVVNLIRERFGLYYVGLFLVDETGEWAELRAGTGEAGRAMLARGHRIKAGEGMIGWCIDHAEARIAEEVGEDAVRVATPELPNTRSEAALALRSRGKVLGAVTIQSDHPGAFDEQSIAVLQTLADQVAVAIDNASLFAESQAALEAERRAYGELSRRAWSDLLHARSITGYQYGVEHGRVIQLSGDGQRVEPAEGLPEVELPIEVHGVVIGTIVAHKPAGADEWQQDEVTMLEELTNQLGIAMESARLYQDTQRRAARERLVSDIADRLQRAPDMEMLLQIAAQELNRVLMGSRAYVHLGVGAWGGEPEDDGDGLGRLLEDDG